MLFKRLLSSARTLGDKYIYFGNPSLNRHSFLRSDQQFITNAIKSKDAKYLLFNNLLPIADKEANKFFVTGYDKLGPQLTKEIDQWLNFNNDPLSTNGARPSLLVHFLGLSEKNGKLETARESGFQYKAYHGTPYFAIDIVKSSQVLKELESNHPNVEPLVTREEVNKHLNNFEASIFAQGKMYLDWLSTTQFCRGCGSSVVPINAGSELKCTSTKEKHCPVKEAPVSNASFPRLDPVLITCVVNQDKQVLLTRLPKFPQGLYSCIAGFIEPGETVENAVKREVWEEAGLHVQRVEIIQSQPWPFPANIMIGSVAYVDTSELDLLHDMELQDARWVDKEIITDIVYKGTENNDLTLIGPGLDFGIANDKTLATNLYKYAVDNIL
ncbi:Peroxisomal NADH pyrophosphatase NUDT12 [Wickerhamomyces ciferrii]|uniref:NAD(+) diphosphatase n=1 Tax=Wickerhamomyces ciferrii (strain ATCC 14091 / BCRC 22168 / CBS 111 / JCM 3599 / NBRC 0793 / NRRL Y-1031 F-60-10) TaxID=1206466 RepID=K0KPJ7_WICCF|nr:Peroxisomal NADH pyrophosphatase NUDT12 [Wickerhamomyces ciferrii]CCH44911.1 Peroxisomal NADH pyrophosphatase NUDT12 [Wickerhamomyces ciferrii]